MSWDNPVAVFGGLEKGSYMVTFVAIRALNGNLSVISDLTFLALKEVTVTDGQSDGQRYLSSSDCDIII